MDSTGQAFHRASIAGKNSRRSAEKLPEQRIRARVVGGEVAEDLFNRGLFLPSRTAMKEEDLYRVIPVILDCKK